MPTTVHLAPVGAGKTEFALNRLLHVVHHPDRPFLKTWVLLATKRQEVDFRQRLVDLQSDLSPVSFNVEFFNFYELNSRLLNIAGQPPRKIQNSARVGILRMIIQKMLQAGRLQFFQKIAHTPGFISVLADLIDELKQNSVRPEDFLEGARTEKDREIASIYATYQDTLIANQLVDLEGEGWLALATLVSDHTLVEDVHLLLVDGYDQFTPVQAQLLAELSRTIERVEITLTTVPERGADYARRFQRALERLEDAHHQANVTFTTEPLERVELYRHDDLDYLGRSIFQGQKAQGASTGIQLIEAPEPVQEVAAVLRDVKSKLLSGIQADDIIIALRDWTRYEAHFETYQRIYNLPLLLHHRPAYHKTPVIAVLIDLLELAPDFRRRDVMDVLRSPYIYAGFTPVQLDLLDRITLEKRFVKGSIDEWLQVIDLASMPSFEEEDFDREPLISTQEANNISILLEAFLIGITPPRQGDVESFTYWLEQLIGQDPHQDPENLDDLDDWYDRYSLQVATQIHLADGFDSAVIRRDIAALNGFKNILRHLLTTDLFLRSTLQQELLADWNTFWSDLKIAIQNTVDTPGNPSRTGRILVTTASDARGLPHQHVYILGMAEGVFPLEVSEDPLYLDTERERLQRDGILLETQEERIDDQGLFYELISLPRKSLTLSRPTVQDGKVWIESHLWRAVKSVFTEIPCTSLRVGQVVAPDACASHDEILLSIADGLNGIDASLCENILSARNWLHHQGNLNSQWTRILHGRTTDLGRLSQDPFDAYSGYITHLDLIAQVQNLLGSRRLWSASQLKDYGLCGFRFFAKRLLYLEKLEEPEEGYDVLQLGSLNHKILEETYKQLAADGVPIHPEELEFALSTLDAIANEWFDKAPQEFGFRETSMWESEKSVLLNRLRALVALDFSEDSPLNVFGSEREPYKQEERFGDADSKVKDIQITIDDELPPLRIRGVIDRIDKVGNQMVLVDYKTGSHKIDTTEMIAGRDFQMMIYVLALQSILEQSDSNYQIAGGMFWHLRSLQTSGVFAVNNPDDLAAIDDARMHIAKNIKAGHKGHFGIHANQLDEGKCVRYCEFSHLCRMSLTNRYKQEENHNV